MAVVDPSQIRAAAERLLGPLAPGPGTFGILPEGLVYETPERAIRRLVRSEPCLFLGPPARSKLLMVAAILERSEAADGAVREFASINVTELGGVWPIGLEDAFTRFPAKEVEPARPELLALAAGTVICRLGETKTAVLSHATPAVAVGRERGGRARRALILVRGTRTHEPAYLESSGP
jgi:hypothetical protein